MTIVNTILNIILYLMDLSFRMLGMIAIRVFWQNPEALAAFQHLQKRSSITGWISMPFWWLASLTYALIQRLGTRIKR